MNHIILNHVIFHRGEKLLAIRVYVVNQDIYKKNLADHKASFKSKMKQNEYLLGYCIHAS